MRQYPQTAFLQATISPVAQLFAELGEAYRNAAGALAGPAGRRLVGDIIASVSEDGTVSASTIRRLRRLRDILSLENVDDLESEEAGFFALIDPASPVVEEICLLTDALRSAMTDHGIQ